MSAENIRRRLVVKLNGTPEVAYIDNIAKFLIQQEEEKKTQVKIIARSKKSDTLEFNFENGEAYELYNFVDPLEGKPKPANYKPPEIAIRKLEKAIVDESDSGDFTIVHFIMLVIFMGLIALSGVIVWFLYNFRHEN
jgi:hypothetical protein